MTLSPLGLVQPTRVCAIPDCGTGGKLIRDLCAKHYQRWRRHGDPTFTLQDHIPHGLHRVCTLHGCDDPHFSLGWCRRHHARWERTGDPRGLKPRRARTWFDLDEARFLIEGGANLDRLCQAFDVQPESVLTQLRRHHADDLAARLKERAA